MPSNSLPSLWQSDFTRITFLSLPRLYTSSNYVSFCTIFAITQFIINRVRPRASAELVHMKAADQFKPKPNSICNAQIRLLIKARALILYPHMCSSHKHIEHFLILNSRNWKMFHGFCFTGYLSSLKTEKNTAAWKVCVDNRIWTHFNFAFKHKNCWWKRVFFFFLIESHVDVLSMAS